MEDKFNWTPDTAPKPIKNDNLVCRNCRWRNPQRTDICIMYPYCKTLEVLKGGICPQYKEDDHEKT